jgi:hypothetical protein
MKTLKSILLISVSLMLCTECKKGEDDPLISLRTRKARVVGNWKMTKGFTSQMIFGAVIETTYSRDGFEQHRVDQGNGSTSTTGPAHFTIEFKNDGGMILDRMLALGDSRTITGTWNFAGGVGDAKNKEQIILHDPKDAVRTDVIYHIKELRNKKLVLYKEFEATDWISKEQFEFEQ